MPYLFQIENYPCKIIGDVAVIFDVYCDGNPVAVADGARINAGPSTAYAPL